MSLDYKNLMRELRKTKKILSEAYVFDEEDQMSGPVPNYSEEDFEDGQYDDMGDEDVKQPQKMEDQDISQYDERISKIREVAIQGLQDYAENVNDPRYLFFKKIFLECDKACQEKTEGKQ